jgi:formamidopyrimidine-DNA glycosylase
VLAVERRGKWLRIALDRGAMVLSHLGMSGKWLVRATDAPAERFERVRIDVAKSGRTRSLRYVDPRMLGRVIFAREEPKTWASLGPDPLNDGVDPKALTARLQKRKHSIKEALLDQKLLAGVGNIQATEALWLARIDPRSRAGALTLAHVKALARGILKAIETTLAHQAKESITYVEERGAPNPFKISGHAGEPCPRCKTPLTKIVLATRGTTFCASCQVRVT